jgi:hypothetical protein
MIDRTLERRRDLAVGISTLFAAMTDDGVGDDWEGTVLAVPSLEFDKAQLLRL